jgi:hypothetical protein
MRVIRVLTDDKGVYKMSKIPEHLSIIEYIGDYGIPMVAMFNTTVISDEEVTKLIETEMLGFEYNPKVVNMTKKQYKNLFDQLSPEMELFYSDLMLEQGEQM